VSFDVLIAWLDAARREDRDGMRALLSDGARWQGVRPEWRCDGPEAIIDTWLERSKGVDDLESLEIAGSVLHLRAPSITALDPRLRSGLFIAFEIEDGRIAGLTDHPRRPLPGDPEPVPEAPLEDGRPAGPGWFVVNVADAPWLASEKFGAFTTFEGEPRFQQLGFNVGVLQPGQPACYYHREGDQEDFLVLKGEALLLVEGQERRLRTWDLFHCPPWTAHVIVGAGDGPCTIVAVGTRTGAGGDYPVAEVAVRHGAGVRERAIESADAYAGIERPVPTRFDPRWLPGPPG
jgi:uncharacterized cupin superfamily protein